MKELEKNEMNAVWELTKIFQKEEDLQNAIISAMRFVIDIIKAEAATIWLKNKEEHLLFPLFSIGGAAGDIKKMSLKEGEGIAGHVTETGVESIVLDCRKDSRFDKAFDQKTGFVTKSMMCVPLKNQKETIGCIQVLNKSEDELYTNEDASMLRTLASIAALAISERYLSLEYSSLKKEILTAKHIGKSYQIGTETVAILKDINLTIYQNELLVILGPSGCGKTTLLNILGCMDKADTGELIFHNEDLCKLNDKKITLFRRNSIGFVFQFYNLMPNLTAKENIEYAAGLRKTERKSEEVLKLVELTDRKDNFPSQLSGGQQQRISIARAVVKEPEIIFADEPTGALDFNTGRTVLEVFEKIVRQEHGTVVIVTHNAEIAKMADRVIHISRGRIADIVVNSRVTPACELSW